MLSYAFSELSGLGYRNVSTESVDSMKDLCAAILARGVTIQLKRGLGREYVMQEEALSSPKSKIDITASLKSGDLWNKRVVCNYDEFSVNSIRNRILKSTMNMLLKLDVKKSVKTEYRKLLLFFDDVDEIDLHNVNWNMQYDRNNQTYRLLISICYLIVKGLLQTKEDGSVKLMDFLDKRQEHKIYEKFILEYFRKERSDLKVGNPSIPWALDDEDDQGQLPNMYSDIVINNGQKYLIIDAKYYDSNMQEHFGKKTVISENLFQIFAYVNNEKEFLKKNGKECEVVGMLLYAKTDEEEQPNEKKKVMGNWYHTRTLDLNAESARIAEALDNIAEEFFGKKVTA